MKKRHIEIIILFCLIVIIPQLTACNNEVEPETIPENEDEIYELDDSNTVIDNNSFEESIISDNKYDEIPDYLQSISEELSEGDYKAAWPAHVKQQRLPVFPEPVAVGERIRVRIVQDLVRGY